MWRISSVPGFASSPMRSERLIEEISATDMSRRVSSIIPEQIQGASA